MRGFVSKAPIFKHFWNNCLYSSQECGGSKLALQLDISPFTYYILILPIQQFGRIMGWRIRNVKILSKALRG
jgi:hypothetical protein